MHAGVWGWERGGGRALPANPLRRGASLAALARRAQQIESSAHRHGLRYAQLSTDQPIDDMVLRTLRRLGLLS